MCCLILLVGIVALRFCLACGLLAFLAVWPLAGAVSCVQCLVPQDTGWWRVVGSRCLVLQLYTQRSGRLTVLCCCTVMQ